MRCAYCALRADGYTVRAAHDGVVTFAGEDGSAGLGVVIRTHDAREYNDIQTHFKTIYWHLKKGNIFVVPGQKMKVGDVIARADNTGLSTGSHLHFGLKPIAQGEEEWRWDNIEQKNGYLGAIDPAPFFNGIHAKDAQTFLSYCREAIRLLSVMLSKMRSA